MQESERRLYICFQKASLTLWFSSVYQMTPLHMAAEHDHSHVVKFLAENEADVNAKNYKGVCMF